MNIKEYIPYYKDTLKLALPVIISQVGNTVVQLADAVMVGRLGAEPLASITFANLIFWLCMVFGMGVTLGLTPLAGACFAQRNYRKVASLFQNSMVLNVGTGALLIILLIIASMFMDNMGQDASIVPAARGYLNYMIISMLPYMVFLTFKQLYESLGNTRVAMMITIIGNGLNIALNYVFIYGKFGAPAMGAEGAGMTTMVARYLMMFLFIGMFIWGRYKRYISFMSWQNLSFCKVKQLFNVGIPIAGQMVMEVSSFNIMGLLLGSLGATVLAAHQIALNIPSFTYMIVVGLAAATTIRISHQVGARAYRRVKMVMTSSIHLVIALMTLTSVLIILLRVPIAMAFTPDEAVIALTSHLLFFAALFQLSDGVQGVVIGGLRGMADVKVTVIIAFVSYIGVAIPIGYVLSFPMEMGATGAWIGFISGLTVASVLLLIRFRKKYRKLIMSPRNIGG